MPRRPGLTRLFDIDLAKRFREIKKEIKPGDNNLVIFHLMGSHQDYCRRFPASFARFSAAAVPADVRENRAMSLEDNRSIARLKAMNCYEDSVAFTDAVLSQLFGQAKQLAGFRAFIYLPDHAEGIDDGLAHDPQQFTFEMAHISLLVWLSDAFLKDNPKRARALRDHKDAVWTDDLLYELRVG
jgi:heptose-I-phosphate ethanolaminephosphotransferase